MDLKSRVGSSTKYRTPTLGGSRTLKYDHVSHTVVIPVYPHSYVGPLPTYPRAWKWSFFPLLSTVSYTKVEVGV